MGQGIYIVDGGHPLNGRITVYGAKNAVLPIMAASVLTEEEVILHGVPHLSDVEDMKDILRGLGAKADLSDHTIVINSKDANGYEIPKELSRKMRSSIFLIGALISRFGFAVVNQPGGCEIGLRPIDLHIKGLRALNVDIREEYGELRCDGTDVSGARIGLDYPSVGATENIIMAAVKAKGTTVIHNAAREPEVVDLAMFINSMGGRVTGAGTDTIVIEGVETLHGTEYTIMPDRIVAGTYMAAVAAAGGDVLIEQVIPYHLLATASKLSEAGCRIMWQDHAVRIERTAPLQEMMLVETRPFPAFPTDMQAQIMAVAAIAAGTSVIRENVFENRFKHAAELNRMGANITIMDRTAIVRGVEQLRGTEVSAHDLRGAAALVIAALAAQGRTTIRNRAFAERGYQDLAAEMRSIGASIVKGE
ncbi:MAG: UDP-N-acetylglucosamine 1-carboxyvinyltransferase [Clostridia bacterium]|nr:UDP-N-acetylglucosamine 1-carboxyvinyltransferase [Clostridia bacterium]